MRSLILFLAFTALSAEAVTENHPDGSKALSVAIDKDGKRDGALSA